MVLGVSPTKHAVVVARTTGSGETFAITSITSVQFQTRSGDDLTALLQRLMVIFDRGGFFLGWGQAGVVAFGLGGGFAGEMGDFGVGEHEPVLVGAA